MEEERVERRERGIEKRKGKRGEGKDKRGREWEVKGNIERREMGRKGKGWEGKGRGEEEVKGESRLAHYKEGITLKCTRGMMGGEKGRGWE